MQSQCAEEQNLGSVLFELHSLLECHCQTHLVKHCHFNETRSSPSRTTEVSIEDAKRPHIIMSTLMKQFLLGSDQKGSGL